MAPSPQASYTRKSLPARIVSKHTPKPLQLHGVYLNWVNVQRDYHFGRHQHTQYELLIPLRGTYRCALNGNRLAIPPGRLLFVQDGDWHEDFYRQGNAFAAFLFTLQDFGGGHWPHGVFAPNTPPSTRSLPLPKNSHLGSLATLILNEGNARRHPSLAVETLVEAFFWLLAEQLPQPHLSTQFHHCLGDSAFRRRLFECFARNLRTHTPMKAIATQLGLSERSLATRCQTLLGTSPARAFAVYRIHEASRLLQSGMQVQETAIALGFADPFHFSKVFKRHLGYSPSSLH